MLVQKILSSYLAPWSLNHSPSPHIQLAHVLYCLVEDTDSITEQKKPWEILTLLTIEIKILCILDCEKSSRSQT